MIFFAWQLFSYGDAKQFEDGSGDENSIVFLYPSKKITWQLKLKRYPTHEKYLCKN